MEMRAYTFLDRRMLAALEFRDPAGRVFRGPVAIRAESGVRWFRKPNGQVILTGAPGLEAYRAAFPDPPGAPATGAIAVTLDLKPGDATLAPRRVVLDLPRANDPANPNGVFAARTVPLLPGLAARAAGMMAGVLARLTRSTDGHVIEGALIRLRVPGLDEAIAVTNAGGEALALVPGVALSHAGPAATVINTVNAEVDAIVDPGTARFHDPADADAMQAARTAEMSRTTGLTDPDALGALAAQATAAALTAVAAGEIRPATLEWTP